MMNQDQTHLKLLTIVAILQQKCGVSSHQIEKNLKDLSKEISCNSDILISPTSISIFLSTDAGQIGNQIRVTNAGIDFFKLNETKIILKQLKTGNINIYDAISLLEELKDKKTNYKNILQIISYGLTAASLTVFFKLSLINIPIALLAGFLSGGLNHYLSGHERWQRISLSLTAFTTTLFLFISAKFVSEVDIQANILAALIVFIPGLSLTVALTELASSHLVSGTARLMGSLVDLFKLSLGVISAWKIAFLLNLSPNETVAYDYPIYAKFMAILFSSLALTIIFNAKKRDFKWIFMSSAIPLITLEFSNIYMGQNLAIFSAAFCVGLYSNKMSHFMDRPVQLFGLPALILLVPGSVALKGLNLAISSNPYLGAMQGVSALTMAVMIVSGLFLADTIIPEGKLV